MAESALGARRWPDLPVGAVVALPLGSCEQHGPHLPLDTDTRIAVALAAGLASRRRRVLVAPALAYGASWEHAGFPGLLSVDHDALAAIVVQLAHSATWAAGIVLVNGHGGNAGGVRRAVRQLIGEGRHVLDWWPTGPPDGDLHAGRTETSMILALAPEVVSLDPPGPGLVGRPPASMMHDGVRAVSPNGILGDPTGATADEGRVVLAAMVDDLVAAYDGWAADLAAVDAAPGPAPGPAPVLHAPGARDAGGDAP